MGIQRLIIIATLVSSVVAAVPATAGPTPEGRAHQLVNAARESRGLRRLVRTTTLDSIAERHSARMRAADDLFHRSNLVTGVPAGWRAIAENVGYSSTVYRLHTALMASSGHRANILGARFDQIGIGIVRDSSGRVYETQVFVDR